MSEKKKLPSQIRINCWDYWVGRDVAISKCMCCEMVEIRNTNFDCGHVLSEANGGLPHINNLRPICQGCNLSMGKEHMAVFKFKYGYGILKGFTEDKILELTNVKSKTQSEVTQSEVTQSEVTQEIPKPNTCMFWEKDLIKKVMPKLIQVPLKKYTGIELNISEEELRKQIEEDIKGLYEEYGSVYKRID